MINRYMITGHDLNNAPFLLRTDDEKGRLVVRPEYADLACRACGKVDERTAFERGLEGVSRLRTSRLIFPSSEDLWIVHEIVRELFSQMFPEQLEYFPISSRPSFYVANARDSIKPTTSDPGFRFFKPCKVCGRHEQIVWSTEAPVLPADRPFHAIDLECRLGKSQVWLVPKEAADALLAHKPKLKGIVLSPKVVILA
jgi:hypothetical protein